MRAISSAAGVIAWPPLAASRNVLECIERGLQRGDC
jgi:hypothetical protein